MSPSRNRGRHAAPRTGWVPVARPRGAGRHSVPALGQPVAVVLLGVTVTSFGLVSLLPSPGVARPAAAPLSVAAAPSQAVASVQDDNGQERRRAAAARASRTRAVPPAPKPVAAVAAAPVSVPPVAAAPVPVDTGPADTAPIDPLPGCAAQASSTNRYGNGRIPRSALCTLPGHAGHALRADAARALARLDVAYRARFGERMCVTDSYRSLSSQYAVARRKPGLAARPGKSEHGYGVAVDLACGVEGYRTPQHRWLVANAGRFGWEQPRWARDGGRREEPWHWELRD